MLNLIVLLGRAGRGVINEERVRNKITEGQWAAGR